MVDKERDSWDLDSGSSAVFRQAHYLNALFSQAGCISNLLATIFLTIVKQWAFCVGLLHKSNDYSVGV